MKSLKDLCPLWSSIMLCNLVFLFLPPPSSLLPVRPKTHFFINTVRRWWNCLPSRRNRKFRKQPMDRRLLRRRQGMRKRRTELGGKWNSWKQSRNNRTIIPRETWGRLLSLGTKRTTCRWEQTSHYHRGRGRFRDGEGHKGVIHQHIDCHHLLLGSSPNIFTKNPSHYFPFNYQMINYLIHTLTPAPDPLSAHHLNYCAPKDHISMGDSCSCKAKDSDNM